MNGSNAKQAKDGTYFISDALELVRSIKSRNDTTGEERITTVAEKNVFEVHDREHYFVCNVYDHVKVMDISGYHHQYDNADVMINHAIHFDDATGCWLFLFETTSGQFKTCIFDQRKGLIHENDQVTYQGKLENVTFHNQYVYKAGDGKIVQFDHGKNVIKEFDLDFVTIDAKLVKKGTKMTVTIGDVIYEIG